MVFVGVAVPTIDEHNSTFCICQEIVYNSDMGEHHFQYACQHCYQDSFCSQEDSLPQKL